MTECAMTACDTPATAALAPSAPVTMVEMVGVWHGL